MVREKPGRQELRHWCFYSQQAQGSSTKHQSGGFLEDPREVEVTGHSSECAGTQPVAIKCLVGRKFSAGVACTKLWASQQKPNKRPFYFVLPLGERCGIWPDIRAQGEWGAEEVWQGHGGKPYIWQCLTAYKLAAQLLSWLLSNKNRLFSPFSTLSRHF